MSGDHPRRRSARDGASRDDRRRQSGEDGTIPGPIRFAAAAATLGGALIVFLPEHAPGIVQLVLVSVAAGAGLHALSSHVPQTGWLSPFKWLSPFADPARPTRRRHGSDEMHSIRSRLAGRRQTVPGCAPLPPDAIRLLQPVIAGALGVDPSNRRQMTRARDRLSTSTWSILTAEPLARPYWFRTLRPNQWEAAEVVHDVLDELERLPTDARLPSYVTELRAANASRDEDTAPRPRDP